MKCLQHSNSKKHKCPQISEKTAANKTLRFKKILLQKSDKRKNRFRIHYYTVLLRTTPVLPCTTNTTPVLLQYYSVLQSTIPVLLCTTKYHSSTTPLLQYYSVLQSTILYYKLLLQYYSVIQSTTGYYKVLLRIQYFSVLQSTTQYYSVLPVVPHKAVAEVSRIGNYRRDWLL